MVRINPLPVLLACVGMALTLLPLTAAATAAPRDVVEQVATLIENNYFDPTRAATIADDLRTGARSGQFDSLRDPRDLATAVTTRLQPRDHHFRLTWSPAGQTDSNRPDSADPGPAQALETLERRNAYGFRRVEMLPGALGYIDLRTFADFSFAQPDEAARQAADAALALVSSADAVVIDLRNNGGGSPNMVGYLVSAFTPPDANIYNTFQHRDTAETERPRQSYPKPRLDVPLYILISGRTASAAESTAYTLQAAKRAVIVGEVSGGAANPGGEFPVGDGFNVFISTSTAINPITGTNWEGVGVKPDVPVNPDKALERAEILALQRVLAQDSNNVETRWILEALQAEAAPSPGAPLADYVGTYTGGAAIVAKNAALGLRRDRRPPWSLVRIHGDVFAVRDEPFRRVQFERNSSGRITRFQLVRAGGPAAWFLKQPSRK
jgi:Peptidase family S41